MIATLYLVPVGLGAPDLKSTHTPEILKIVAGLDYFIVERAKSARADLKKLEHPQPIQQLQIEELPNPLQAQDIAKLIAPLREGRSAGLMSEAGCPAVADPGALIVRAAHANGIRVAPLIGPSSLLLALMASGLNGQSFAFHGYLPINGDERIRAIRSLEKESKQLQRTQLFIETPYRNDVMFASLISSCAADTLLCVARSVTTTEEWIATHTIREWKKQPAPELARSPTVFLLLGSDRLLAFSVRYDKTVSVE